MIYQAQNATVKGNVIMGDDCSVWYGAVVRTGKDASITVGRGVNMQDNCVLHVDKGGSLVIGDYVTIGHGAVVHCSSVGDNTLIGMGAILLHGAKVGRNCIIGAGALVTGKMDIPDNSMVMGAPAQIKRCVTEEEKARNLENARHYIEEGAGELPHLSSV